MSFKNCPVADPGFPRDGAPTLRGRQDTILLKFPENCMKLKKIRPPGSARPMNPQDLPRWSRISHLTPIDLEALASYLFKI